MREPAPSPPGRDGDSDGRSGGARRRLLVSLLAPEEPPAEDATTARSLIGSLIASRRVAGGGVLVVDSALPRLTAFALRTTGRRVTLFAASGPVHEPREVVPLRVGDRRGGWRRTAASLSLRFAARVSVAGGRPLVVATAGRPPAAWLLDAARAPHGVVSLRTSWRGASGGGVVATVATLAGNPIAVAKIAVDSERATELSREERALVEVAPAAATAGVTVPRLLDRPAPGVLLQNALPGRHAVDFPSDELVRVFRRLVSWLARWNAATERPVPWLLRRTLDAAAQLEVPQTYRRWLERRVAALGSDAVNAVATHGDLTLWNVLVEPSGAIGVVDWEDACPDGLPLSDLFYAAVDADLHAQSATSRADAVARLSAGVGPFAEIAHTATYESGIEGAAGKLLFHATWLVHAADEARRNWPGTEFRDALAVLADNPDAHPRITAV